MSPANNLRVPLLLCLSFLALPMGCTAPTPQAMVGHHLSSAEDVFRIQRVVFIELHNEQCSRDIAKEMTDSILLAIKGKNLFLVDVVYRSNPIFEKVQLVDNKPLSMPQIRRLREVLKCDAVLFGSLSRFRPPPRMQMGLYLSLVDLRQGGLVWGVDHIWDSSDKLTEKRIEHFFDQEMANGYEPANWRMGLLSPKIFGKFVAYEAADTLPLRNAVQESP